MRRDVKCPNCGASADYSERHDAYQCSDCDRWLEKNCGDAACEFCAGRPDVPSQAVEGER